jgi:hypothetical protein
MEETELSQNKAMIKTFEKTTSKISIGEGSTFQMVDVSFLNRTLLSRCTMPEQKQIAAAQQPQKSSAAQDRPDHGPPEPGFKSNFQLKKFSRAWAIVILMVMVLVGYFQSPRFIILGSNDKDIQWLQDGMKAANQSGLFVFTVPSESKQLPLWDRWKLWVATRWTNRIAIIVERISSDRFARDPFDRYKSHLDKLKGTQLVVALRDGSCSTFSEILGREGDSTYEEQCRRDRQVII